MYLSQFLYRDLNIFFIGDDILIYYIYVYFIKFKFIHNKIKFEIKKLNYKFNMTALSPSLISRKISYINHKSHITNIPNPEQIQYLNFTHSIAWTFPKEKKCTKRNNILYIHF